MRRRDAATLIWYGLLFSAIVLWASLRSPAESTNSGRATRATLAGQPLDRTESVPEVRHITQRMMR